MKVRRWLFVCLSVFCVPMLAHARQAAPARPQSEKKAPSNALRAEPTPFVAASGSATRTSPASFGAGKKFVFFNGSPRDLIPKERLECFDVMGNADATQEIACRGAGKVEVWVRRSRAGEMAAKSNAYLMVCWGQSSVTRVIESTCDPLKSRAVEAALKAGNPIDPGAFAFARVVSGGLLLVRAQLANVAIELSEFEESNAASATTLLNAIVKKMPFERDAATLVEPTLSVFPTASGSSGAVGLIPADENFPAIIDYQRGDQAAGVPVRFSLLAAGGNAQLRAGAARGATVTAVTDETGRAQVNFHYLLSREPRLTKPQEFTVLVDEAGQTSKVTVRVGLGLVFDRASYLKGSFKLGTYPLPLSVKSSFYPALDVGLYLLNADKSGAWQGKAPGFQLVVEHQNAASGNRGVRVHTGTGRLARVENATLLLTDGEPRYYMNNWELPAVEIKDPGTYVYRVNAKLCVLDASQRCIADNWAEGMIPPALVTIVTEDPESWYQSLACSFEAKDIVQYAMFETAKMLPVYGQAVDAFGTATSLTCKLLQRESESAFYDLGTVLGGKYLDHLKEPAVYAKLTSKQQAALDLAKAAYDKLDEHAKSEQRKELIKKTMQGRRP